jgi:hypothetical protein
MVSRAFATVRSPTSRRRLLLGSIWGTAAFTCLMALTSFGPDGHGLTPPPQGPGMAGISAELATLVSRNGFSGVTQVPGTELVALVDDDEPKFIFVWRPPGGGSPAGEIRAVDLPAGARIRDAEGITTDGSSIYVIGSHSLTNRGRIGSNALVKLRWIDGGFQMEAVINNLRDRLEAAIPALAVVRFLRPDDGGLNIEGLAWQPDQGRLLLGLRGPLVDGRPAVIPLKIVGSGSQADVVIAQPVAIDGIDGFGIRAIQHDPEMGGFLVITGGVGRHVGSAGNRFTLWWWSGVAGEPASTILHFPARLGGVNVRPEGVSRVTLSGGDSYILVVTDDGPFYWRIRLPEASRRVAW